MDHRQVADDLREPARALRQLIPDVMQASRALGNAAMREGAITTKDKELIALAIAIVKECDGCIVAHARGALRRGATRDEVAEMIGVTIMMDGGPATVWGPRALEAYDQLAEG